MSTCVVCEASTDAYLCKPCLGYLERDLGDYASLLHEASNLALGRTKVYRASRMNPLPDEELAELDEEYQHRMRAIPARLRSRDGRMALPSTQQVVNLDARELIADAYDTLRGQVDDLRDLADSEPANWDDVVPWLLRNANHIRFSPDAESIYDELTYMHGRLERAVDRSPDRIYAGPCTADGCGRDLYSTLSGDSIKCDGYRSDGFGCGAEYTYADREKWLLEAVNDALLPLDMWRTALPKLFPDLAWPHRATWLRWSDPDTGRLTPHGQTQIGDPRFRGGDVISLVVSEQARIVGNRNRGGGKGKATHRCA